MRKKHENLKIYLFSSIFCNYEALLTFYVRRTKQHKKRTLNFDCFSRQVSFATFPSLLLKAENIMASCIWRNFHYRDLTLPPNKYNTHRVLNPVGICVFLLVFCPGRHCKHHSEKICPCRFCSLEKKKKIVKFHAFPVLTDFVFLDVSWPRN